MMHSNSFLSVRELDEIKQAYCNKEFIYIENKNPLKLNELLPWVAINQILYHARLTYPRLRIHREGTVIPELSYSEHFTARRQYGYQKINEVKFYEQLRQGGTLVIDAIDELYPTLNDFIEELERFFQEKIQANAYMSWHNKKGFTTHWDDHDVLILQIHGKKDWYLFGKTRESPLYKDFHTHQEAPVDIKWNKIIKSGDILFIPRGHWHHAIAIDEPSLHLTLGFSVKTSIQFVTWIQENMAKEELFRRDLPVFKDELEKKNHEREIKELFKKIVDYSNFEDFFSNYRNRFEKRTKFSLPWAITEEVLPTDTDFKLILNVPFLENYKIDSKDRILAFIAQGKEYKFSIQCNIFFQKIMDHKPHDFSSLLEHVKNEIKEKQFRDLLSNLVLQGLLAIEV